MATSELQKTLDLMGRSVSLEFEVLGGRVFAHHAQADCLDRQTIELKCESGGWFTTVIIGDEHHERINLFAEDDENRNENQAVEMENGWQLNQIATMLNVYEVGYAHVGHSGPSDCRDRHAETLRVQNNGILHRAVAHRRRG